MTSTRLGDQISLSYAPLDLILKHPFAVSYGSSPDSHNILVKLNYQDLIGYGEASPVSYHNETIETANALLKAWQNSDFLGDDPFAIELICQKMNKLVAGNASVKAAIEMALHDLCGKIANLPTYKMLGLSALAQPITDLTIGIDSLEMIEKKTQEAVDAGYKVLKIKQGTSYDKEIIKSVRQVSKTIPLRVDANGAWTAKQAIEMAHFLAEHGVQLIEQPLPRQASVDDFRFVRQGSPLPIFADESCCTSKDVARLANAVDGVVIKLAKTGGLLEAMRVIHTARAHAMQLMFGCMVESSLSISAAVHLAGLVDYLDLDGALLLLSDPFDGVVFDDGFLRLPDRPGLGAVPRHS